MNKDHSNWFSISSKNKLITCADCNNEFDLKDPFLDHHPSGCPICKVECAYLDWKNRKIQIIMQNAPPTIFEFIRWMQKHLDELEYVELFSTFESIDNEISRK